MTENSLSIFILVPLARTVYTESVLINVYQIESILKPTDPKQYVTISMVSKTSYQTTLSYEEILDKIAKLN
jgi:hypothetical protein